MSIRKGFVYILFNRRNGTLYTGVTSNITGRRFEHKTGVHAKAFSNQYAVNKLGYIEEYDSIWDAIKREKQIKAGSRVDKIELIEGINPGWHDLFDDIN